MASATLAPTPCTPIEQPEPVALGRGREADQADRVLRDEHLGVQHHLVADRAQLRQRAGRGRDEIADAGDVDHREVGAEAVEQALQLGRSCRVADRARALARWWAWVIATASASAASAPASFAPGSSRWIIAWTCDLLGAADPDHRLLDQPRRIFADLEAAPRGGEQHDAARLAELQRRLRIFVEEHFLDRGGRRADGRRGRRRAPPSSADQAGGQRRLGIGADLAVGDVAQPVALGRDHAPAGAAEARIEADDQII